MHLDSISTIVGSLIGVGAMVWGGSLGLSAHREYRRSRTVTMEVLNTVQLDAGRSYRLRVVEPENPLGPRGEARGMVSRPQGFGDRTFEVGEHVSVDHDPGYPAFFYPPGRYPKCRLWLPATGGVLIGAAVVASTNGFF